MFSTRPKKRDTQRVPRSGTSITRRLARAAAIHPWRVVAAWGLILAASIVAIGTLLGSAFTSDASLTTSTDSVTAEKQIADNFPRDVRVDDAVIIHSGKLIATDREFRAFVADVRSSIKGTGAARTVRDPYAPHQPAISKDGHAAVMTLVLGHDAESGIVKVLDEVSAANAAAGFDVTITGANTLDHDFAELSQSDLTNGELRFGLPAAMIVLIMVFGALVAAFVPISIAIGSIIVTVAISSVLGPVHVFVLLHRQHDHRDGTRARHRLQPLCSLADTARSGRRAARRSTRSSPPVAPAARQCCSLAVPSS